MFENKIVRRSIAVGACFLLMLITAFFPAKTSVYAGAGGGEDGTIGSVEELSVLLGNVFERMDSFGVDGGNSAAVSAVSAVAVESKEHESVTVQDTMQFSMQLTIGEGKSEVGLDRKMTAYFTKEASYYVVEGTASAKTVTPETRENGKLVHEEETERSYMTFKFRTWTDREVCLLMFDRLTVISNSVMHTLPSSVTGKWIAFSLEEDEALYRDVTSVDSRNYKVLSLIGEVLADKSNFDHSNDIYTMTETKFRSFVTQLEKLDGVSSSYAGTDSETKGRFVASLKNSRRPHITLDFSDTYSDSIQQTSVSLDASSTEELTFSNIDNTVLKGPSADGALTPEELVELLKAWED